MKTFIVDSFTDSMFKGNPVRAYLVGAELSASAILNMAAGRDISEAAFVKNC
jgi:predicted PhzF superfamily epimerase YddE/YHI9